MYLEDLGPLNLIKLKDEEFEEEFKEEIKEAELGPGMGGMNEDEELQIQQKLLIKDIGKFFLKNKPELKAKLFGNSKTGKNLKKLVLDISLNSRS